MKKNILFCSLLLSAAMTFTSCSSDEPANAECDIEQAWVHMEDPGRIFYHKADTTADILPSYDSNDIQFPLVRYNANIGMVPFYVVITPGAKIYQLVNGQEVAFASGSPVDFSADQEQRFRVRSEDGAYMREYTIRIKHDKEPSISTQTCELGTASFTAVPLSGNQFSADQVMDIPPYGEVLVHIEGTYDGHTTTFTLTFSLDDEHSVELNYAEEELRGTWNGQEIIPQTGVVQVSEAGGLLSITLPELTVQTATLIHFNFEDFSFDQTNTFHVWSETDPTVNDPALWATGNPGFQLSMSSATWDMYPSVSDEDGVDGGRCVKLTTRSTGSFGAMVNMRIAAGNLFTGSFDVGNALKEALAATLMGKSFAHKPLMMRGYYKFVPGSTKQDKAGKPIEGETDVCDFYCVVYKNTDADGNKVQLDGNILDTDKTKNPHVDNIVGIARVKSADIITGAEAWNYFELPVAYSQELEQDDVLGRQYSVAVVFSSSIDGAYFRGAVGSTLWIDNVTLMCEY